MGLPDGLIRQESHLEEDVITYLKKEAATFRPKTTLKGFCEFVLTERAKKYKDELERNEKDSSSKK